MRHAVPTAHPWSDRWQRFSTVAMRLFHSYANWLVGISWRRFIVYALLLTIVVAMVHDAPPFTWRYTEQVATKPARIVVLPRAPRAPATPAPIATPAAPEKAASAAPPSVPTQAPSKSEGLDISISRDGLVIRSKGAASATAPAGESAGVQIKLPPGVASEAVAEAVADARRQIEESVREAKRDAEQAKRDAEQALRDMEEARHDAERAIAELNQTQHEGGTTERTARIGIGDAMMQLTVLFVMGSAVLKYSYKGRMQAEVKAAQATETAEAESLKRQVVEARMAAMQAQVEPHFLFNTLASIDHLIEVDPARASLMQKNLIALLRASMPTMREANGGSSGNGNNGVRELGRELAVIRPYLEILKVRMEERLVTEIDMPEGLLSAEFPPMMIQTLVENAIKHGLEPKAEGGSLKVKAEIVHGKLQVRVADTGLGFGKAATAGTGVGLANIRERLQLLYGSRATLTVAENQPSGTVVTITVPYKTVEGTGA